jgi:flagellar protein FliO/FliZ
MVKAILALVVVLGVFGGAVYVYKNFLLGKVRAVGRFGGLNSPIKVLSKSYLEPRKHIAIVDVAGEVLVLGITQTSISFLTKLEEPEAIEAVRNVKAQSSRSFIDVLKERVGSRKNDKSKD